MKVDYPVRPIKTVDDTAITRQLPTNVMSRLGPIVGSGFDLRHNKRDLQFECGSICYVIDSSTVSVAIEEG